jgi:transcriptional regulator
VISILFFYSENKAYMFIPTQFNNENLSEVKSFLKANSFGILTHQLNGRPWGTHIPMILDQNKEGHDVLLCHLAKSNPAARVLSIDLEVLAIFNGPHGYISSSLYSHDNVSTWNYIAVHIYGIIKVLDQDGLVYHLQSMVDHYESTMPNPKKYADLGVDALRQIKGIVGYEIKIEEIQAAYKLSQNRNDLDFSHITTHLQDTGLHADIELCKYMNDQRAKR